MLHEFKLEADDLSIIPITENDIQQIRIWRNKDHIRKNFIYDGIIDEEQQKQWFEKYKLTNNDYVFIIKENRELCKKIGTVSIYNFSDDLKKAEFGRIFIGDDEAQGRGYGVLASKMICNIAFNQMNLEKLALEVFEDNKAAYHVYEKIGFKKFGLRKNNNRNLIQMELKKKEFEVKNI